MEQTSNANRATQQWFRLTPIWVVTIVFCGIAIYLAVKNGDNVRAIKVGTDGAGIDFSGGVVGASDPEKLREVADDIKRGGSAAPSLAPPAEATPEELQQIEAIARRAPTSSETLGVDDIQGVWYDGAGAMYQITPVGGVITFSETSNVYGVPLQTAVGQGRINDNRFEFAFNSIIGMPGVGVLQRGAAGTLTGTASFPATNANVPLNLRR